MHRLMLARDLKGNKEQHSENIKRPLLLHHLLLLRLIAVYRADGA